MVVSYVVIQMVVQITYIV